MSFDFGPTDDSTERRLPRRTFVKASTIASLGLATIGTAGATPPKRGFPPNGVTEWSDPINLGDGELRTFTSVTPSDEPKYHGVYLDRACLSGLPWADEVKARGMSDDPGDKYGPDGEAVKIHHAWSQEFFVPFPATEATPFTFLGLTWNPAGHPPDPIYGEPHFDIHFHMLDAAIVDAIEGLAEATYDFPDEYVPEGFQRIPEDELDGGHAVVTDMGEHLADLSAPDNQPGGFENTLIWGAYDPDDSGEAELTFVEPMVTKAYLEGLSDKDTRPVAQPETYAKAGTYPTAYSVRDLPESDALAITIEDFTTVDD